MNLRAFTLIEVLCVAVIIASLTAILTPVISSAKMSAKRTSSLSRMQQIYAGLMIYQADYDGAGYGSASKMGLPPMIRLLETLGAACPSVPVELWMSPCGYHEEGPRGFWSYSYHADDDTYWSQFAEKHEGRTPLLSDLPCSDVPAIEDSPLVTKSVPFLNLDGQARIARGIGIAIDLEFFVQ